MEISAKAKSANFVHEQRTEGFAEWERFFRDLGSALVVLHHSHFLPLRVSITGVLKLLQVIVRLLLI